MLGAGMLLPTHMSVLGKSEHFGGWFFSSSGDTVVLDGHVMWYFQCIHTYACVAASRKSCIRLWQKLRDEMVSRPRTHTCVCVVDVAGPWFEFAATEVSGHQFV